MKTQAYLTFLCCICWFSNLHAQFIKEYYKAPQATSFHAIVPVNETLTSNLFIAGTYGKQIIVGEVEQDGDVVWMKKLIVESKRYLINAMIKDSDGNLILCGGNYIGIGDNGFAFLIKFNPVTKSIMWFQQTNENILFFDCAEMGVGGNYVIGGQDEDEGTGNGADHLTMIADRETGSLSVFTSKNINLNETVDALLFDDASNFLYTTGRYELDPGGAGKFRGCLDKIDSVGNVVWTKYYIKDNASIGRFYPKDIIKDGDALVIAACGDDEGYDIVRNFYLLKVDLEGNIIWVNKYDIEGVPSDGIFCSIRKHLSGYIITGSLYDETYTDIFIINTNFEGDINWAKSFPYRKKTETFSMQMSGSLTVIGDKIFHVGEKLMPDGSLRGILLSASVANADFNICSADINLTKYLYVEPYQGEYVLTNAFLSPTYNFPAPLLKNQSFNEAVICAPNATKEGHSDTLEPKGVLLAYPNPACGQLFLSLPVDSVNFSGTLRMFPLFGQEVLSLVVEGNEHQVDVSAFGSGVYFLVLEGEGGLFVTKVFIEN